MFFKLGTYCISFFVLTRILLYLTINNTKQQMRLLNLDQNSLIRQLYASNAFMTSALSPLNRLNIRSMKRVPGCFTFKRLDW